jgi:hypothetical protein
VPTSGVITGEMTARDLCTAAAKDLGVYGAGETLSDADAFDMMTRLNWLLKTLQAKGTSLWRVTEGEAEYLADEATVALDPRCIDVLEARFVQSSTYERPLARWELGQWQALPNKAQPGYPTAFYLNKQVGSVTMSLWPVPNADATIRYSYSRVIEDVTDLNETIDVPQEWMETLWTMLAARCVTLFGVTRIDPAAVQLVIARAAQLETELLDQDRPASYFMGSQFGRYF